MDKSHVKKRATGASCTGKNVECSECDCYLNTENDKSAEDFCPYTKFKVVTAVGPNLLPYKKCTAAATKLACQWGELAGEGRSYLVDLTVELYGTPCKNAKEHPGLGANWEKLLNENRVGCDKDFGKDDTYS